MAVSPGGTAICRPADTQMLIGRKLKIERVRRLAYSRDVLESIPAGAGTKRTDRQLNRLCRFIPDLPSYSNRISLPKGGGRHEPDVEAEFASLPDVHSRHFVLCHL